MDYANNLIRLIYSSKHTSDFQLHEALVIENTANKKNPLIGVTGMLFCNSEGYLQVLEGPRVNVSNLFLKISQDTRHKDPMLISVEDIQKRMFGVWAMRVIDSSTAEENVIEFLKHKYDCQGHKEFPIMKDVSLSTMFLLDLQTVLLSNPQTR